MRASSTEPCIRQDGYGTLNARKKRFLREMSPDLVAPFGAVIQCVACLAMLTLGIADYHASTGSRSYAVRGTEAASDGVRAAAHRNSLFEERRERFNGFAHAQLTANSRCDAATRDAAR
jgi:hypothetical protein